MRKSGVISVRRVTEFLRALEACKRLDCERDGGAFVSRGGFLFIFARCHYA